AVAEKTQTGPTHGAEEQDDGPPPRPQRAIRKHRAPAARVRGGRRCGDFDRYEKEELLGNFHRTGTTFTAETVETFDHDFGSAGQGKLIPHGIYDLGNHHSNIHPNTSHD